MADNTPKAGFAKKRVVAGIVVWSLYGALLLRWAVLEADIHSTLHDLAILAVMVFVVPVITLWWIHHNMGIYRDKGPRRSAVSIDAPWTHDYLGRPLSVDPARIVSARLVTISVDREGTKCYRIVGDD